MATRSMFPDISPRPPRPRGFAAMNPELQRAIASAGGRAAHEHGTAHEFTPDEARRAGRKGGQASARRRSGATDDAIH